jgi:xanthine dehydrogenase accessory factor
MLIEEDGQISGDIAVQEIKAQIIHDAEAAFEHKQSKFIHYTYGDEAYTAFIEFIAPPISLVVIGAGNDALPMVNLADELGWETIVVDGRNNLAKQERFVAACQVLVSKPDKVLEQIPIDSRSAFVLMTHNYNYDLAMLEALILKDIKYIGSLGPKKKLNKMLDEMKAKGIELSEAQLSKIYGPVGLEIGAETAEEIALSIISEIQAVFNHKKGGMLREKSDVIHSRSETSISYNRLKHEI